MNYSTSVFLINDDVRAVMCTYEDGDNAKRTMFKTFDNEIDVDDFVIVPTDTRHNLTVCKVVAVDVDVDFDSAVQVDWIVGAVEMTDHIKVLAMEEKAIEAVKSAEKRRRRDELRASVFKDQEEKMKALEITSLADEEADDDK